MRGHVAAALKEDATRGSAGRRTGLLRAGLAAAEIALALVLLIGAGLLIKSFVRVTRVDPGFSVDRVMTAQMTLPSSRYPDAAAARAFWQQLLERTQAIPGVTAAGVISSLPFSGSRSAGSYTIVGRAIPPRRHAACTRTTIASPATTSARWGFRCWRDACSPTATRSDAPRVVVVDRFLADKQFPGESAIGHQFNFGSQRNYTIVGVVGTVNAADLAKPVPEERIYFNAAQLTPVSMTLVLKTAVDARLDRAADPRGRARDRSASSRSRGCGRWGTGSRGRCSRDGRR